MSDLPPLRSLEAFRAVMRHGAFASAAASLGLTASAISHRISDLEAFLGIRLFERRNRAVVPTDAAHRYNEALRESLDRLAAATRAVAQSRYSDVLSIHASPTFGTQWLMPRLKTFIAKHPEIDVRLSSSHEAVSLQDGLFDAGIQYGRAIPAGCEGLTLAREAIVPLCAPDFRSMADLRSIPDLARTMLLHSVRNLVQWDAWLSEQGALDAMPVRGMHFDRSFMAIAAAVDGLGVCLESTLMAEREITSGRLIMPFGHKMIWANGHKLVWRKQDGERQHLGIPRARHDVRGCHDGEHAERWPDDGEVDLRNGSGC